MENNWKDYLKKFNNQQCKIKVPVNQAFGDFLIYIFDSDENKDNVESIIEDVIGPWEFIYEQFNKSQGSLTMFAIMFGADDKDENPFESVDAVLFYDINTGEVYKFEEADFSPLSKSWTDKIPYKLDKLKIEIVK
jgi:hypothetical protein